MEQQTQTASKACQAQPVEQVNAGQDKLSSAIVKVSEQPMICILIWNVPVSQTAHEWLAFSFHYLFKTNQIHVSVNRPMLILQVGPQLKRRSSGGEALGQVSMQSQVFSGVSRTELFKVPKGLEPSFIP